jgi:mRNA-degrading endonuclease RelE of RelBE toxin-antitoxin system
VGYNLIITPSASLDVAEACVYYEGVQSGLSNRFLSELLKAYNKLSENPQHYSFIASKRKNNLRDIGIRNFPYLVVFEIDGNTVTVYSVFHTRRKPKF